MKKHRGLWKRFVSLSLVFTLCCSLFAIPTAAAEEDTNEGLIVDTGEITVTSESSVGDLLANTIEDNEPDTSEACYITGIEVTDATAYVSFQTFSDSDIVVGIYTEDEKQLLASGTSSVTADDDVVSIALTGEIPDYFVASAYLLDAESHHPLSEEYTSLLYTHEMQDLINKTADDFAPERVVMLDNDPETNFAVFPEDVVMAEQSGSANLFTDNGDGTYTVTNADESVTSLQPGDVFTYDQGGDQYIIVVESIAVNGTTVIITEKPDADLTDAFQYVKIEAESEPGDIVYGDGTSSASVPDIQPYGLFDPDDPFNWADEQTLDIIKIDGSHIKGSVSLKVKEAITCYVADKDLYLRVQIDLQVPVDLKITGSCNQTFSFKEVEFHPLSMVWIEFTPAIVFRANGTIDIGTAIVASAGFEFDTRRTEEFVNIGKKPALEDDSLLDVEASLYVGFSLRPEIVLGLDFDFVELQLVSGYIQGEMGLEATGSVSNPFSGQVENVIHDCTEGIGCIRGTMSWKGAVTAGIVIPFIDTPWENISLWNDTVELGSFYYSITHHEFGWGICPHYYYQVVVQALDQEGNPLPDTAIKGTNLAENPVTDENGEASFYLPYGYYTLRIQKDNLIGIRSWICIAQPQQVTIQLTDQVTTGGNYGTGGFNMAIDGLEDIIFDSDGEEGPEDSPGEDTEPVEKVTWVLTNGRLIISGNGPMESCYDNANYPPWYDDRESIISVYIESGITTIETNAFYGCSDLTSITIPEGITTIGNSAFRECSSLTNVTIPYGVVSIGSFAFQNCNQLIDIQLPDSIMSIGGSAFSGCSNLKSIEIPNYVTVIESCSFKGCNSLISVSLPDGLTVIGWSAFSDCTRLAQLIIPETVVSIEHSAFLGCINLESIELPSDISIINSYTFSSCSNLKSVVLKEGVNQIGFEAFQNCTSLSRIVIPNTVKTIEANAFSNCDALQEVTLFEGITSIGDSAFSNCQSLNKISLPNSLNDLGDRAFYNCTSLTEITIPGNIQAINELAFYGCSNLQNVYILEGITAIGRSSFSGCVNLSSISIPDSVASIDVCAFESCTDLVNIKLPENLNSIGERAFIKCSSLTDIVIPETITVIEDSSFSGCSSLVSVTFLGDITVIGESAFSGCSSLTQIDIPDSVTVIKDVAFSSCESLVEIVLPPNIATIEWRTFWYCTNLREVVIPEGVKEIGKEAFSNCNNLININIPISVESIGDSAFYRCKNLLSIEIPEGVSEIPYRAFYECENLRYVVLSISIKSIDTDSFIRCSSIETIYYSGTEIDWNLIEISASGNHYITSATIHYNSTGPTAEDLAALTQSANLNSAPDSMDDFTLDLPLEDDSIEEDILDESIDVESSMNSDESQISDEDPLFTMSGMEQASIELLEDEDSSMPLLTTGSGQQIQSTFSHLVADEEYVLIVAVDITAEDLLAADNLLYMAQGTADMDGSLSFEYFLPESLDVTTIYARVFGKSNKDLANATVVVDPAIYNGMAQTPAPIVVYDGVVLQEGIDYTVSYSNNDRVGTGFLTVVGKIGYSGSKTVSFTITNGVSIVGDLNYDGSIDARDLVLMTRYVAGWTVSIREDLADVNGDDQVDGKDVIMLTRYLAGWGDAYKPVS